MKTTLKLLAFLLSLTILLLTGAGCAKETPAALSYGNSKISTNMYRYWLSSYKGRFLYTYTDMTDTDPFWDTILYDDITAEAYLNSVTIENLKRTILCMELFAQHNLKMPDTMLEDIDSYISDLVTEHAGGSRKEFNALLAEYGINIDMLRDIYIAEDKAMVLFDYLYGDGGPRALTEEALDAYYKENYVRIRHIYVNNAYVQVTNEAGYPQYDSSGNALTRTLTEEELTEKQAIIDAIEKAITDGEDFASVYETYSEDKFYVNGYYLTKDTPFITEVVDAAFRLAVNDWICVRSDYGTHYIKRLPLEENAYNESTNGDFFTDYKKTVQNADFYAYLESLLDEVTVHTEEIEKYSVRDAAVNYSI